MRRIAIPPHYDRKPLLYVADRYRGESLDATFRNILAARDLGRQLWLLGAIALVPHLNTLLMDGPDTDALFLAGAQAIQLRCDGVVLGPTWELSAGARAERNLALAQRQPLFAWPQDRDRLTAWIRGWSLQDPPD